MNSVNVATRGPHPSSDLIQIPRGRWYVVETTFGVLVVLISILSTLFYLHILYRVTEDDYFWINFNSTGSQSYLADVFNTELWTQQDKSMDLFSVDKASLKDYSQGNTSITIYDTFARRFGQEYFDNVPLAVSSLRNLTIPASTKAHVCYCWLDFERKWEVAHTKKRQERCVAKYSDNGAVYMESVLRNIDWTLWYNTWGTSFEIAYGSAVRSTSLGVAWLKQTSSALHATTIADEIKYWNQHQIKRYRQAWQNARIGAFDITIIVYNTLASFTMPLNHVTYLARGSLWTSAYASFGVWNDFAYAVDINASLVRNASNSFTLVRTTPELWCGGYPDTPWSILLHDTIGPIGSIDLIYTRPPLKWIQLVHSFYKEIVTECISNDKSNSLYCSIMPVSLQFIPVQWKKVNYTFYGGNPLCYQSLGRTYPQQSFGFDDSCAEPHPPMTVDAPPRNILLALVLLNSTTSNICRYTVDPNLACDEALLAAKSFLFRFKSLELNQSTINTTLHELFELNIKLIQDVSFGNATGILQQPLIDLNDTSWTFYGWLHLIDWVLGIREVVAFEGDESTLNLISKQYTPQVFVVDPLQIPTRFSSALRLLFLYMSFLFLFVFSMAFLCGFSTMHGFYGRNLFFSNRVVGLVWIGRPLLIIRGVTAMALLSSANVELSQTNGFTSFIITQRTWFEAGVLVGESLWLTYVLHDVIALVTKHSCTYFALSSSSLVWISLFLLEITNPFKPTASLMQSCQSIDLDYQLSCVFGTVSIGSWQRFLYLLMIQFICTIFTCLLAIRYSNACIPNAPVIIPAIASYVFKADQSVHHYYDPLSSVLCGLFTFQPIFGENTFSILLWLSIPISEKFTIFQPPTLQLRSSRISTSISIPLSKEFHIRNRWLQFIHAYAGIIFILGSITTSFSFIYISQAKLTNDFLWEGFNTTGMQAYLIDWYNTELLGVPTSRYLSMDESYSFGYYNSSITSVSSSMLYPMKIQYEDITLLDAIYGLRRSEVCQLPWIGMQYCYVDFNRRWEMANTIKRQERCKKRIENGAIYIESIFRNVNFNSLLLCWGNAIQIGIFSTLEESLEGQKWIENIRDTPLLEPEEELNRWIQYNIHFYTTQWQNYKTIGLIEKITIENAMGYFHPFTLKASNGSYRYHFQTSMKMNWGLANDWNEITNNQSTFRYQSLIQSASNYAFLNKSIEMSLIHSNIIPSPLDHGLAAVRATLGPFGSIDMYHIPCPIEIMQLYQLFIQLDIKILKELKNKTDILTLTTLPLHPIPIQWQNSYTQTLGGSILCPANAGGLDLSAGILAWFGTWSSCGSNLWEPFYISRRSTMMSFIAWGGLELCTDIHKCLNVLDVCHKVVGSSTTCIKNLQKVEIWAKKHFLNISLHEYYLKAQNIRPLLETIEINQYGVRNGTIEFARFKLFDPNDLYFQFFSWHVVWEWAIGHREVVLFEGDLDQIKLLTKYIGYASAIPNPLQVPTNVVYYSKIGIQYTTSILFAITLIALLYTLTSRGYIEGYNMLEINRVGGIVWVGRPLLCLRSLVALCFLSTATVKLEIDGLFTTLTLSRGTLSSLISTILAGSETSWFVIVLSDLCMAATKDHTNRYSLHSTIIASIATALLSILRPVEPLFSLSRSCEIIQMDFQLVCSAGNVSIGRLDRVVVLVILTTLIVIVCYVVERCRSPRFKLPQHKVSLLLPAGAHYLYYKKAWIFDGIYYIDKASAFICGLIAVTYKKRIYLLDIKTWRTHTISVGETFDPRCISSDKYDQINIQHAVPLVD